MIMISEEKNAFFNAPVTQNGAAYTIKVIYFGIPSIK